MSQATREWKNSLTIRKHIPSGRQYVPSDEISATVRWDDGEGLGWHERFQGLNEATAQAVSAWVIPALQRPAPTPEQSSESGKSTIPKPPDEAALERLPWKLYREGHSAGWIFSNHDDPIAQQLRAYLDAQDKLPVSMDRFKYRFSGRA